jgi:hypothetical protein
VVHVDLQVVDMEGGGGDVCVLEGGKLHSLEVWDFDGWLIGMLLFLVQAGQQQLIQLHIPGLGGLWGFLCLFWFGGWFGFGGCFC